MNNNRIKAIDLINWNQVSIYLAGAPNIIRKSHIPKQYKKDVFELIGLIDYWMYKTQKDCN